MFYTLAFLRSFVNMALVCSLFGIVSSVMLELYFTFNSMFMLYFELFFQTCIMYQYIIAHVSMIIIDVYNNYEDKGVEHICW